MGGPFLKLNYADIEKKVNNSYMECSKLIKQFEELEETFRKLIENKILDYRSTIEELSRKAEKQWGMEKKLMEIIEKLKELKLDIFPYKGTYILKGMDEV